MQQFFYSISTESGVRLLQLGSSSGGKKMVQGVKSTEDMTTAEREKVKSYMCISGIAVLAVDFSCAF